MFMFGVRSKNLLTSSRRYAQSALSMCCKSKIHCGKSTTPLIHRTTGRTIAIRHFFGVFKRPKKEELKIIDNIPDEYKLIYRNTMDRYILLIQFITTVSTLVLVVITVINNDFKSYSNMYPIEEDQPQATENEMYYYVAAFVTFVVILQMLVYKLPMRIYYLSEQKQYTFIFYGSYPLTKRKLTCSIGEVCKLPEAGSFSLWKEMKYQIKDQQDVIMTENFFRRSADLYIMLGVQRDPNHETPK